MFIDVHRLVASWAHLLVSWCLVDLRNLEDHPSTWTPFCPVLSKSFALEKLGSCSKVKAVDLQAKSPRDVVNIPLNSIRSQFNPVRFHENPNPIKFWEGLTCAAQLVHRWAPRLVALQLEIASLRATASTDGRQVMILFRTGARMKVRIYVYVYTLSK